MEFTRVLSRVHVVIHRFGSLTRTCNGFEIHLIIIQKEREREREREREKEKVMKKRKAIRKTNFENKESKIAEKERLRKAF